MRQGFPLLCHFSREQLWLESGWGGEVLYLILLSMVFGSLDFCTALNLKRVWEELLSAGRGCFMSRFSEVSTPPLEVSAEVGAGGTGFYSFDVPKHPTKVRRQPWTPSPPDISRRLPISERGLLSLCSASLSPTLLPGLGHSSAILPGVRLNTLESYTSLLFLGAHLTLRRPH